MNPIIMIKQLLLTAAFFTCSVVFADQPGTVSSPVVCSPGSMACDLGAQQKTAPRFVVYYFHGNKRCQTCRAIETNAEKVIRQSFANELQSGKLDWRIVNTDLPENKHFISDFNLYSSALVIVDTTTAATTRSQTLEKVWPLAHSEDAFNTYVAEEVRKFIGL